MGGRSCFFQAEDGIRDLVRSRGLGDVYKRQPFGVAQRGKQETRKEISLIGMAHRTSYVMSGTIALSLIHI